MCCGGVLPEGEARPAGAAGFRNRPWVRGLTGWTTPSPEHSCCRGAVRYQPAQGAGQFGEWGRGGRPFLNGIPHVLPRVAPILPMQAATRTRKPFGALCTPPARLRCAAKNGVAGGATFSFIRPTRATACQAIGRSCHRNTGFAGQSKDGTWLPSCIMLAAVTVAVAQSVTVELDVLQESLATTRVCMAA